MPDWSDRFLKLRLLLAEKLGARGADFGSQLQRAGRRLPRRVRREAEYLARVEQMARHPKFARLVDPRSVTRSQRRVARHLEGIDLAAIRRERRKDQVAALAFYVLVTFALAVMLLWWRGIV